MSADSLPTSTAVSTETPTSARFSAGASLMPSPRKPTTWPLACRAWMRLSFCAGESRAKAVASSASPASLSCARPANSAPVTTCSAPRPTSRQTLRVTKSLSPASTLTVIPACLSARMARAVESLGGSKKAR
jgi:hypothetical protein